MNHNCFLAIENKHNNYTHIDTKDLETSGGKSYFSLEKIDLFTMNYTKDTLAELILNSNIVSEDVNDLSDKLCVITADNVKGKIKWRKYELLSKEKIDNINLTKDYLKYVFEDKDKTNDIYNILIKYAYEYKKELKDTLDNKNAESIIKFINTLDYINQRTIYFKIENMISKDTIFVNSIKSVSYKNLKKQN